MMGRPKAGTDKLFYVGFSVDERMPADHPLRRVASMVDFSFVRREVGHLYGYNGNESIDPTLLLKLMFLLYWHDVRSERELMRQLPLRLDWLWFCDMELDESAPHHSVLSKARRRWGVDLFESLFERVLERCVESGLVKGQTVHADSTLLKANASRESRVSRVLWEQLEKGLAGEDEGVPEAEDEQRDDEDADGDGPGSRARQPRRLNERLVSRTDPDAATHTRGGVGTVLGYRDHRLIDDHAGVIIATHVTPADGDDGRQLPQLLELMRRRVGRHPAEIVGDGQYGTLDNYERCARTGIRAYLKKRRGKDSPPVSWLEALPPGCSVGRALYLMGRRRNRAEGSFGDAHTHHDHRRCRWRREWRVQIGSYLVATVQNMKKLIKAGTHPRAMTAAASRVRIGTVAMVPWTAWQLTRSVLHATRIAHPRPVIT